MPRPPKDAVAAARPKPLNRNQLRFLEAYLATYPRNGQAAYLSAYKCKPSTAAVEASKLLRDPRIVAEIERRESPTSGRFRLEADKIRQEVAAVAFSDIRHYAIAADGSVTLAKGAPDSAIRAVASFKVKRRRISRGDNLPPIEETETEVKLWDKPTALRLAAQVRGLLVKRVAGADGQSPVIPSEIEVRFVAAHDGKPVEPGA